MRNIQLLMHVSLDGFVAGLNGEMDWIKIDEQIFDYVGKITDRSDTAMYGRATYQMMDNYWTHAGEKPNASKHVFEHSRWYNKVNKVVISNSLKDNKNINAQIIGNENLIKEINALKKESGGKILMLGSPSAAHSLMRHNLIDEYQLFVNPVLLGEGIPLFRNIHELIKLQLVESRIFSSGVVNMHYDKKR